MLTLSLGWIAAPVPPSTQLLERGRQAARAGDWHAAERALRECSQQEADSVDCTVEHAQALTHLSQPFDGILELEALVARRPDAAPALKALAHLLDTVALDRRRAEEIWLQAAKLAPNDAAIWHELGAMYAEQQRAAEAVAAYKKAVALRPADALLIAGLAFSYGLEGDSNQAEREFARARRINDQSPAPRADVMLLYASFLRDSGRAADSVAALNRALQLGARNWRAYYERARSYERLGDYAHAAADAQRALQLAGNRRDIHLLLLRVYRGLGDTARVNAETQEIRRLSAAEDAQLTMERQLREALSTAEAAVAKGDCNSAIPPYETVTRLLPTFYEAWLPLGVCYSSSGRAAEAGEALRTYLHYQPLSADGHAAYGLVLMELGRWNEARAELKEALAIEPNEPEAAIAAVRVELELHDAGAAVQRIRALLANASMEPSAELYALAVRAARAAGEHDEALSLAVRGMAKFGGDAGLQEQHAAVLLDCVRVPTCRLQLAEALRNHSDSDVYLKATARAMSLVAPREDGSARLMEMLSRRMPNDPEVWAIVALWHEFRSEQPEAREAAAHALSLLGASAATRVAAQTLLAQSALASGDRTAALAAFQESWNANRGCGVCEPGAAVLWAEQLERDVHMDEAAAVLDATLSAQPYCVAAHLARARQFIRAGEPRPAIEHGQAALRGAVDEADLRAAHAVLAQAYSALGNNKEAQRHADWIGDRP